MKLNYENRKKIKQAINDKKRASLPHEARIRAEMADSIAEGRRRINNYKQALDDEGFDLIDVNTVQCRTCGHMASKYAPRINRHLVDCPNKAA